MSRYNLRNRVVPALPPKSPKGPPPRGAPPEQEKMSRKQYVGLLNSLFPSKYMSDKTAQLEDPDESDGYETTDSETEYEDEEESEYEEEEASLVSEFSKLVNQKPESERAYMKKLSAEEQEAIVAQLRQLEGISECVVPPRIAVIQSGMPDEYKAIALKKLAALNTGAHDGEYHKLKMCSKA